MDTDTEGLISVLNDRMGEMTNDERIKVMDAVMKGYCIYCGCVDHENRCQCWNDE